MIQIEKMMIGDWVMFTSGDESFKSPLRIEYDDFVRSERYLSRFDYIPITPDILEKNGFKIHEEKEFDYCFELYTDGTFISIMHRCEYNWGISIQKPLTDIGGLDGVYLWHNKYVHELQHLLRFCQIEKKIKI